MHDRLVCRGRPRAIVSVAFRNVLRDSSAPFAEILLYDIRRTATLAGPSAVYVDPEVEKWLLARTGTTEVAHFSTHHPIRQGGRPAMGRVVSGHLGPDEKLTVAKPKPYWQSGWLKQHDRLIQAMSAMKGRVPLVVSGDMHAVAIGRMMRSGTLDLKTNPVNAVLSGPIGIRPGGWPSSGSRNASITAGPSRYGRER